MTTVAETALAQHAALAIKDLLGQDEPDLGLAFLIATRLMEDIFPTPEPRNALWKQWDLLTRLVEPLELGDKKDMTQIQPSHLRHRRRNAHFLASSIAWQCKSILHPSRAPSEQLALWED